MILLKLFILNQIRFVIIVCLEMESKAVGYSNAKYLK